MNGTNDEAQQISMRPPTLVSQVIEVQARLENLRRAASERQERGAAREFSIAITASEDLIMRINRGMAMAAGDFQVADYEQLRIPDPDPDFP
jgi:hypothetical protein